MRATGKNRIGWPTSTIVVLLGLVGLASVTWVWFPVTLAVANAPMSDVQTALYTGRTIVTGRRAETRDPALPQCLEDVLVKVSGAPDILKASGLGEVEADVGGMVVEYSYHDRMESIPVHDEQGSRDRPYDLTVVFDPTQVDAVITRLGFTPWRESRPPLLLVVKVHYGDRRYPVTMDGTSGQGHREAILEAAWKRGLVVKLPSSSSIPSDDAMPDSQILSGDLTWNPDALTWTGRWRHGQDASWEERATSFDAIYRDALGKALALLRGRPAP
ncbi:MAG: DUF2066 domain-containing protein [Rhodospirillum sp.]|nr:DUF2066 domain-containing protein [Rhodospirillum sp.]MCF8490264.1 DUF2066 domain-containing protein [Rhodospirillum sp.]MCF8499365.1 DUF2066 domain-containing protein [Rhodospirillum sp.]